MLGCLGKRVPYKGFYRVEAAWLRGPARVSLLEYLKRVA